MSEPRELVRRILSEPRRFTAELLAWVPKAPPGEVAATRNQLVDVDAYVRRNNESRLADSRRAARLTEWEMARRWPVKRTTGRRGDDRPALSDASDKDADAWQAIYAVGRVDRAWLLDEPSADALTQAAVIRKANGPKLPNPHDLAASDVLLIDPPWRYDYSPTDSRKIENHYPTADLDTLSALTLPAGQEVVAFCWATSPKLTDALQLLDAWQLTYRTSMVWIKDRIGMGYYARQRHELLLIATRGEPPTPEPAARPDSVIDAPRGAHSAKPTAVYELIERMYPNASKRELFARQRRDGWLEPWGLDVPA